MTPEQWLEQALSLIRDDIKDHTADIKGLEKQKLSTKAFFWTMAILFGMAASIFGMQVANIIATGKMESRLVVVMQKVDSSLEKSELQIEYMKTHYNTELDDVRKMLDQNIRRVRDLEELCEPKSLERPGKSGG